MIPGRWSLLVATAFSLVIATARAADVAPGVPAKKENALVDPPDVALRKFTVAPGLKVDLFAAEPDVRNSVAISIDERGRVFVVESDRRRSSVFDIRGHKDWLESDLSFRTVEERINFLKQQVSSTNPAVIKRLVGNGGNGNFADFNKDGVTDWRDLEVQSERIRMLEDTNGDGRADRVSVFADGFTNIVAGVAAGVPARGNDTYFSCIPDLWKLTAGQRTKLLSGFGVHIAFGGHDMHGLIMGPDGKLYWSIADRGTDTNLFAKIKNPIPGLTPELLADSGCVFRANPDGSDFEVIAWGLRNPQELAFDEYGNLFTADNNGDGGDKARWHYVVEGADFGWRIGWQWIEARAYQPKMGPWNGERLWHLAESNTAAYLLPPLAHVGHGPAGLAYNPGTGLPAQFDRHFLLCDFPGHVLMWTNIPDGASFKVGPVKNFFGDLGPTDVAFHPDGGVLVSDWFKSFDKSDKGRLYRIHDPATDASKSVQETKRLLAEGMNKRGTKELAGLLRHADMRVRLGAQWELVDRTAREKDPTLDLLVEAALRKADDRSSRLHAIWTLSQIATKLGKSEMLGHLEQLLVLLRDRDPIIRAKACGLFQKAALLNAQPIISELLSDPDAGVSASAAMALSKPFMLAGSSRLIQSFRERAEDSIGVATDRLNNQVTGGTSVRGTKRFSWTLPVDEVEGLLRRAKDSADPLLRHAGVMLLDSWWKDPRQQATLSRPSARKGYWNYITNNSPGVRLGALLALRRLGSPDVARFLSDPDPRLVLEAARAINDVQIESAYPQLAALVAPDLRRGTNRLVTPATSELEFFTLRRALNANFRIGHATNALALAAFAARSDSPEPLRIEALELLGDWPKPPARDHIMGLYRPLPSRDGNSAAAALRPILASILRAAPKEVKLAATHAAAALGVQEADFFALVSDIGQPVEVRVEALKSLVGQNDSRLPEALKLARNDKSELLRIEAGRLRGNSGDAVEQWSSILERGSFAEKQGALASIAVAHPPDTDPQLRKRLDEVMSKQLDVLLAGTLPKELVLDVLDAAQELKSWNLAGKVAQYQSRQPTNDALAAYRPALYGGNAESGKKLFIENQQLACFRCHKIHGEGGDVGPDLTGLSEKKGREYLLQSIVQPNKEIAVGFESVLVDMKNGASFAGLVKSETETELVLNSPEDGVMTLKKAEIKTRQRGLSAMPEELVTTMSKRELRDIIEFLATAK